MATLPLIFLAVSVTFNLPPGLLSSLCYVESNHRIRAINIHDGGSPSVGVCQVKDEVARSLGYKGTFKKLWLDPNTNVYYAGKLLRYQLDRYKGDIRKSIAAYNAGAHKPNKSGFPKNHRYVSKVYLEWQVKDEKYN